MIVRVIKELRWGSSVLLFPEGTRTVEAPINRLKASVAIIAKCANVPVQTLVKRPSFPVTYRVRLCRRFEPPADARALTGELDRYISQQLAESPQNRWIEDRRGVLEVD